MSATKAASSKFVAQRAIVLINLRGENGETPEVVNHLPKILAWYQKQVPEDKSYYQTFVKSFKLTHMFRNIFELTYMGRTDMVYPSTVISPDDDGNHPITINKKKYLVSGYVLKELKPVKKGVKTGYMMVSLKPADNGADLETVRHVAKIKSWYRKEITKDSYYSQFVKGFKITHIHNDIFEISFKSDSEALQSVANPDDAGSHPLLIKKKNYLVGGVVLYTA